MSLMVSKYCVIRTNCIISSWVTVSKDFLKSSTDSLNPRTISSRCCAIPSPDNRLDSLHRLDIIKRIEERVDRHQPECVYIHHAGDVNIDHRRLHEAVVTACRPMPGHVVRRLLSFEVASSTEWQPPGSASAFQPNWFVDISAQWERKREALIIYANEMRTWPHARSLKAVEHLARWRGAQVGVEAAEAFCLLRQLL